VGLPLGIFLDGELLAGPTVREPVTDGRLVIAGLSLREAEILAAQLPFGPLPLPVSEVSVAKTAAESGGRDRAASAMLGPAGL